MLVFGPERGGALRKHGSGDAPARNRALQLEILPRLRAAIISTALAGQIRIRRYSVMLRLGFGLMAAVLVFPAAVFGQRAESGFLNRVVVDGSETRRYQVFVPSDYSTTQRWPVILFLHGGGEEGDDGFLQTEVGLGSAIRRHADRWPAIVVFPQVRPGKRWNGQDAAWALKALDETQREFATDPSRVYLTGLSCGGAGAY